MPFYTYSDEHYCYMCGTRLDGSKASVCGSCNPKRERMYRMQAGVRGERNAKLAKIDREVKRLRAQHSGTYADYAIQEQALAGRLRVFCECHGKAPADCPSAA